MSEVAWPVWSLELTPSSGTADSYPLEVGVGCWTSPDAAITTWSTAISPADALEWSEPAPAALERVGLDLGRLKGGMSPKEVAETLNDVFMTATVHRKGGTADVHLANRLNLEAKVWPTYSLASWREVCERHPEGAAEAWSLIRGSDGDAGARAGAVLRAIAVLMGCRPEIRTVSTMAVPLPV
jgi:hypothetical protein